DGRSQPRRPSASLSAVTLPDHQRLPFWRRGGGSSMRGRTNARWSRWLLSMGLVVAGLIGAPASPAAAAESKFPEVLEELVVDSPGHLQVRLRGRVTDPDRDTTPVLLHLFVHYELETQLFKIRADANGEVNETVRVAESGPVK